MNSLKHLIAGLTLFALACGSPPPVSKLAGGAGASATLGLISSAADAHRSAADRRVETINSNKDPVSVVKERGYEPLNTLPDTSEEQNLRRLRDSIERIDSTELPIEIKVSKEQLIKIAQAALEQAEYHYSLQDTSTGDLAIEIGSSAVDLALGLTPGVGRAKDIVEATCGVSIVSGQALCDFEQTMAVVAAVPKENAGKVDLATKSIRMLGRIATKAGKVAPEAIDAAEKILKILGDDAIAQINRHGIELSELSEKSFAGLMQANLARCATQLAAELTEKTTACYSGPGNRARAEAFMKEKVGDGGITLEKTVEGRWLDAMNDSLRALVDSGVITNTEYRSFWSTMSASYARAARGKVHVFQNGHSKTSTFINYELPELLKSRREGRVTEIICEDCGDLPPPWEL